jgi:linoleoyl-CoA desaturase
VLDTRHLSENVFPSQGILPSGANSWGGKSPSFIIPMKTSFTYSERMNFWELISPIRHNYLFGNTNAMQTIPFHKIEKLDTALMMNLYNEVNKKIKSLPESRLLILKIKVFILPLIYLAMYLLAIIQRDRVELFYLFYALMGLMVVLMFINLIHEACHGNIFKSRKLNSLVYYMFDFLGANSYIWQQRHLLLHHRFPNTNGWDADIEQKGPVSICSGESIGKYHRFQHIYVFFFYPFFMLNWLFVRDFRDFFSKKRVIRKIIKIPVSEYIKLIFFKSFFLYMIVGVPFFVAGFSLLQSIFGILIMTITGSILALFVLLTSHINVTNHFPVPEPSGEIPFSWFRHQFLTTNDIDNTNWFICNIMGNFNYHLAHHLFPRISSVYAPEVTSVLKEFALVHNLPYRSLPLSVALKKHYQLIRDNAHPIDEIEL